MVKPGYVVPNGYQLAKEGRRWCVICGEIKPVEMFALSGTSGTNGRSHKCRECVRSMRHPTLRGRLP